MPNNSIITPKALAIIILASAGKEVGSFIIQLLEQLLIEAQSRIVNIWDSVWSGSNWTGCCWVEIRRSGYACKIIFTGR